jgi:hypothetical protein
MRINKNKQFWIFSLIAIVIYATIWLSLAWPYRPFPGDDIWFFHHSDGAHHPLFIFSLTVVKWFLSAFSTDEFSYFLVHGILSNSLSLFLLSAIVFRLTQNRVLVILTLYRKIIFLTIYLFPLLIFKTRIQITCNLKPKSHRTGISSEKKIFMLGGKQKSIILIHLS